MIAARHVRTLLHLAHLLHADGLLRQWLARSAMRCPAVTVRLAVHEVLRARDWRPARPLADAIELLAATGRAGFPLEPATEAPRPAPCGPAGCPTCSQSRSPIRPRGAPGKGTAEQISDNVTVPWTPARRRLVEH